jgi:PAS domain S-box-containing protein
VSRNDERALPYRAIVENSLDAIVLIRPDLTTFYASPSVMRVLGYPLDEFVERSVFEFIHPDDLDRSRTLFAQALDSPGKPVAAEVRCRHRDGSWRLIEVIGVNRFDDPEVGALIANYRDLTDRKIADEELKESREQLRKLSRHINAAREEERTRISREIHDELGQKLTVLKMSVSRLRQALPREPEALQSSARAILDSIDGLLRTVRDVSTELRPAVLDHLGLVDAIKWQARQFETRTGIPCPVRSRLEGVLVDSGRTTDLFRVVQEALTNVVRHARATRVQIQMLREAGDLLLEVSDNGQGIKQEDQNRQTSLGLLGIRERIQALGGTVELSSTPSSGTRLRVRIPLIGKETGHEEDPDRR